jgi:hypothetical protein
MAEASLFGGPEELIRFLKKLNIYIAPLYLEEDEIICDVHPSSSRNVSQYNLGFASCYVGKK